MKFLYAVLQVLWFPAIALMFIGALAAGHHASIWTFTGWMMIITTIVLHLCGVAMLLSAVIVGPAALTLLLVQLGQAMCHPRRTWRRLRVARMARRQITRDNQVLG